MKVIELRNRRKKPSVAKVTAKHLMLIGNRPTSVRQLAAVVSAKFPSIPASRLTSNLKASLCQMVKKGVVFTSPVAGYYQLTNEQYEFMKDYNMNMDRWVNRNRQ